MKKYIVYIGILAVGLLLGWMLFGNSSSKEAEHNHNVVTETNQTLTTLNKHDLNRKLEKFYNKLGCEEMNLVSNKFWKKVLPTITLTQNNNHTNLDQIPILRVQ